MRYLMAAVAVITCPCHLPILAAVLSGTVVGAAITERMGIALAVLTALFIASAWSAVRLFSRDTQKMPRSVR